jgi:hypothetical protein
MPTEPDDKTSAIRGEDGERVAPAHGSSERSRQHAEELEGSHGEQSDDQSLLATDVHHSSAGEPVDPRRAEKDASA